MEFIGRLYARVACHLLGPNDVFTVLRKSESRLFCQFERSFVAYGIRLTFCDEALPRPAERARDEQTGARGLTMVLERMVGDVKFRALVSSVRRINVTAAFVDDPLGEFVRRRRSKS